MVYDAAMSLKSKSILDNHLPTSVRIGYAELCNSVDEAKNLDSYKPLNKFQNAYKGSVKVVSDGSNQGLTGRQYETYCCEPADNRGIFNFKVEEFYEMVRIIIADKKWPMMIHANAWQ